MKNFSKNSIITVVAISLAFYLTGPIAVFAATTPSLGAAASYGVLSSTYTDTSAATTVNGDVGFTTPPASAIGGTHTNYGSGAPYSTAGTDQNTALTALNNQACDFTYGSATDLSLLAQPLVAGVHCVTGAMSIGTGGITLGSGTYIFRSTGALNTTAASIVSGGDSCDIFWTPVATTLGVNTTFKGTVIDNSGITVGANTTWTGRALDFATTVTTDTDTITVPTCAAPSVTATLHIIKHVINDNGGTAVASNFTVNVAGTNVSSSSFVGSEAGTDVTVDAGSYAVTEPVVPTGYLQSGSGTCSGTITAGQTITCTITNDDIAPQLIVNKVIVNDNGGVKLLPANFSFFIDGVPVISGVATTTTIGLHTVSETPDSGYTKVISGNCAADGTITLALGDVKTCVITNNDVAQGGGGGGSSYMFVPVSPLIDVVKVPSPLALPAGPGQVVYTYTLRNIGVVPVTNITMIGDTCSPITIISGDINGDSRLDVNETWVYRCSTTLSATHTNIITATGMANGITATDIASATVVVGIPVVPPLIHVTKVPSPLALFGGNGMVTYTNKVTNPGTVALSNIQITDDKCSPLQYISGDTNGNSKLDVSETWMYTCKTTLFKTTTNTVTATGQANGLTATDFAIATVIVSAPSFPNTALPDASGFGQRVKMIATTLIKGSRGDNVIALQQFLMSQDKGSSAQALTQVGATGYFGILTRAALAEFQASVDISPAWGNFGPITRAYLKANY